jgi:hypothetical protein
MEEVTMRFVFAALILSTFSLVCGTEAGEQPVSVLNHGQSTPTAAVAASEAAPPAATTTCRNGRCCTGPNCRLYNVEESVTESCRPRVFGGYVKKNTARTVYRPARR